MTYSINWPITVHSTILFRKLYLPQNFEVPPPIAGAVFHPHPNPNHYSNANSNPNPQTENNLEQIQLSVCVNGNII